MTAGQVRHGPAAADGNPAAVVTGKAPKPRAVSADTACRSADRFAGAIATADSLV
ncbi:MAG TPA: hypothetical protein VIQ52_18985 [Arthrobacter sp.]